MASIEASPPPKEASTSTVPDEKTTSSGRSAKTGPRCGLAAVRARRSTTGAMSSTEPMVTASLVTGASSGTWSSSCSEPDPQRFCGARPPSTTSGEPLKWAVVVAEIPLVMPGPAVSATTPGRRVSFAIPSAAKVAVCSWRVSISRMAVSPRAAASSNGKMCPPESVNNSSTPKRRQRGQCQLAAVTLELAGLG